MDKLFPAPLPLGALPTLRALKSTRPGPSGKTCQYKLYRNFRFKTPGNIIAQSRQNSWKNCAKSCNRTAQCKVFVHGNGNCVLKGLKEFETKRVPKTGYIIGKVNKYTCNPIKKKNKKKNETEKNHNDDFDPLYTLASGAVAVGAAVVDHVNNFIRG